LGTIAMSSKVLAKTALIKPANENIIEVRKNVAIKIVMLYGLISTKKEMVKVTASPAQNPLATPPDTYPVRITQFGVGETKSSSKLLLYLVIKKEETVLA
jgi:hypothetical protein